MKISNVIVGFLSTAAVIALGGVSIGAAEQAMFVLNSGERHSGTLVYGRGSNNIVDERFHLNVSDREHTFGLNDVAVIEFDGGRPTSAERQSVATDTTAVMVMRNGSVQRGHLHNIIGGDLVQWVNEAGQRNNYPIRDISRLYLNPQRALAVFLNSPGAPTGVTAAQGGIRVDANQAWAETGMVVRRGDRVIFNATGDITLAPGVASGVNGTGAFKTTSYPVPAAAAGALIGGVAGRAFAIGSGREAIAMPADGRLMLGVNDDHFADNTGFFTVVIAQQPRRGARR